MSFLIYESDSQSSDMDENYCDSNDADSMHPEEEEDEDANTLSLECNPSDTLIQGSIILHIDQTDVGNESNHDRSDTFPLRRAPFENNISHDTNNSSLLQSPHAGQSTSASEATSENMSTRAVMGDTPTTTETNSMPVEDEMENSSQVSMTDSADAERVRRMHNSIFNSLEHDLAELVRIREETIEFLETGTRSSNRNESHPSIRSLDTMSGDDVDNEDIDASSGDLLNPILLRERLTFHARPFRSRAESLVGIVGNDGHETNRNTITMDGRSYTPIAKFDNVPSAKPAKPFLEVGLTNCEEKAGAARKIIDKLQYGFPEDEGACFVRRFWRETSTVGDSSQDEHLPTTIDAATLAQRTASLQASLEEAFGGLRMRLQRAQPQAPAITNAESQTAGSNDQEDADSARGNLTGDCSFRNNVTATESACLREPAESYYERWNEETSIMNNPLNYDIWNELEDGSDAGTAITARINLSERQSIDRGCSYSDSGNNTNTIGVGTDTGNLEEGDELDDSVDENQILSWLGFRDGMSCSSNDRRQNDQQNFSPATREFFLDIGISEELGRDIFNMFTLSEADIPCHNSETPEPLFPRDNNTEANIDTEIPEDVLPIELQGLELDSEESDTEEVLHPQVSLIDNTEGTLFTPNREDDCSTRVYLDENDLNFSRSPRQE